MIPKLWGVLNTWLNVRSSTQLLITIRNLPAWARRCILGGLVMVKFGLFLLAAITGVILYRRRHTAQRLGDSVAMMLFALVVARTITTAIPPFLIGGGVTEDRYELSAWPGVIGCGLFAVGELAGRYKRRRIRQSGPD